ncbi:MAG: hypothetical protein J6C07_09810 [Lachnospiraceae bacterium]|nr:hypothetical protein [Lachnospiraceae bacterium]
MTGKIIVICLIVCVLAMSGCRSSMDDNTDKQDDDVIYTYEMSDSDSTNTSEDDIIQTYEKSDKDGRVRTYYELSDGRWKTENWYYKDRVILSGRTHNAISGVTLICLSNIDDITFSSLAESFLSSNYEKHYSVEEVILVEIIY